MNRLFNIRPYLILITLFHLTACYQIHHINIKDSGVPQYSLKTRVKTLDRLSVELSAEATTIQDSLVVRDTYTSNDKIVNYQLRHQQQVIQGPATVQSEVNINELSINAIYGIIDKTIWGFALTGGLIHIDPQFLLTSGSNQIKFNNSINGISTGFELQYHFVPKVSLVLSSNHSHFRHSINADNRALYLNIELYKHLNLDIGYQIKSLTFESNQELLIKEEIISQCSTLFCLNYQDEIEIKIEAKGPKLGLRYQF